MRSHSVGPWAPASPSKVVVDWRYSSQRLFAATGKQMAPYTNAAITVPAHSFQQFRTLPGRLGHFPPGEDSAQVIDTVRVPLGGHQRNVRLFNA